MRNNLEDWRDRVPKGVSIDLFYPRPAQRYLLEREVVNGQTLTSEGYWFGMKDGKHLFLELLEDQVIIHTAEVLENQSCALMWYFDGAKNPKYATVGCLCSGFMEGGPEKDFALNRLKQLTKRDC